MRRTALRSGSEFRANTYTSSDQIYSSVTALNDGGFVVTWSSEGQDGSGYGIYGQRYAADGSPVGDEFRANTYTTNAQDLFLRDGAQRRRLRGDVVVGRPGRQRLWHLRPALCGGRHAGGKRVPPSTRSPPAISSPRRSMAPRRWRRSPTAIWCRSGPAMGRRRCSFA